jgi:cysteine desulfurase
MQTLNFDANAAHGLTPFIRQELERIGFEHLNANSIHRGGQRARSLIEEARVRIASLLGVGPDSRIVFTSGATEANNTALQIPFQGKTVNGQLVTSAVEHHSVLAYAEALKLRGASVSFVTADREQGISQKSLLALTAPDCRLVSLIWACNETGTINPLNELISTIRLQAPHTLIHSDAVQVVGRLPLNFERTGLDMMTVSGHKLGGLGGVGALVIGRRVPFEPLLRGGSQELYHRAGTENVLGIVSFGLAALEIERNFAERIIAMRTARDFIFSAIARELPQLVVNTSLERSLPNTLNMRIPGIRADDLIVALDRVQILISSGAACASGKPTPSHVLLALGLNEDQARESVRISLRGDCTLEQAQQFVTEFVAAVRWMQETTKRVVGA